VQETFPFRITAKLVTIVLIMRIHASCAARPSPTGFDAVLLLGEPGSGKSDLLLRLLARGWRLVADDQVIVRDGFCAAPESLAGIIEVRGLGLFRLPFVARARPLLVARLGPPADRLPAPSWHEALGLPEITINPRQPSAPERLALAFDALTGRAENLVGAFAA
jgi:HPr kinase/phosphorylase